jgi:hypothetical protein
MRGLVACGWCGIQTWVGGAAIHATAAVLLGFDATAAKPLPWLGISGSERRAGFRDIRWHPAALSPDAPVEQDHDFWSTLLESPPLTFIECVKP